MTPTTFLAGTVVFPFAQQNTALLGASVRCFGVAKVLGYI